MLTNFAALNLFISNQLISRSGFSNHGCSVAALSRLTRKTLLYLSHVYYHLFYRPISHKEALGAQRTEAFNY